MNTKHTPGPWTQKSDIGLGPKLLILANDAIVARATSIEDAKLIALAPDMREELQSVFGKIQARMPSRSDDLTSVSVTFTGADMARILALLKATTA